MDLGGVWPQPATGRSCVNEELPGEGSPQQDAAAIYASNAYQLVTSKVYSMGRLIVTNGVLVTPRRSFVRRSGPREGQRRAAPDALEVRARGAPVAAAVGGFQRRQADNVRVSRRYKNGCT